MFRQKINEKKKIMLNDEVQINYMSKLLTQT